jgi:hypothetical protein
MGVFRVNQSVSVSERQCTTESKNAHCIADKHPVPSQDTRIESTLQEDSNSIIGFVSTWFSAVLQPHESPKKALPAFSPWPPPPAYANVPETKTSMLRKALHRISKNVLTLGRQDGSAMQRFEKVNLDAQNWQFLRALAGQPISSPRPAISTQIPSYII